MPALRTWSLALLVGQSAALAPSPWRFGPPSPAAASMPPQWAQPPSSSSRSRTPFGVNADSSLEPLAMRRRRRVRERGVQTASQRCNSPHMSVAPATTEAATTEAAATEVAVRPIVKYTVPQSPRGWRGRGEEFDEDPKSWYDAEGKRNGPPPNYWRQAMDERLHGEAMEAIDELLDGGVDSSSSGDANTASLEEAKLAPLEERMSLSRPLRNRKLLGRWAVLVADGIRVASCATAGGDVTVLAMVEVERAGERRTMTHRYGVFDEHMEEGELLSFTLAPAAVGSSASASTPAREDNSRLALPLELACTGGQLHCGGVSLLNDYLLVARGPSGELREVFMRVDEPSDAEDSE